MGIVVLDISISLDGFVRAADPTPDEPLGVGGEHLHAWMAADEESLQVLERAVADLGATICGRTTYDDSIRWWGADGPSGPARRPLFVVTHEAPSDSPANGVYTFVTGGIEAALDQARAAAGDGVVAVMGGANLAQQYLKAGLVDEISLHLAPVLFGSGMRLFDDLSGLTDLEPIEVLPGGGAVHLRYKIKNNLSRGLAGSTSEPATA
ncbi:dihydrofolate reductase family protein [uncultured Pseudonocardia sp.]|uniref:dihydrofolate reductase family protein n=1 Tax=uncultured Pseudonocardia sp. TaxID=211455 RepID=UPI00261897D8|nr:dihydrofolate reductase family protein [uncultured Pseudonocardia sp.]